jgi:hypothetical protein
MKRFIILAVLVLVALTMVVGAVDTQLLRLQMKHNLRAGDGSGPIPTCRPGTNCGPDGTLRQVAGDGSGPIPTCRPGTNCGPDGTLRQVATYALSSEFKSTHLFAQGLETMTWLS